MKKLTAFLTALSGLLAGILLTLAFTELILPAGRRTDQPPAGGEIASEAGNEALVSLALGAADALKAGDFEALADMTSPDYGLVLSHTATVNLTTNLVFTPEELRSLGSRGDKLVWGVLPDSGLPISMTPAEYFARYVFDRDYTAAPILTVDYTLRVGNSLENVTDTFPGARFVDLCYPGTQEADYNDWSILRLVFEEHDGALRLAALIHSEAAM